MSEMKQCFFDYKPFLTGGCIIYTLINFKHIAINVISQATQAIKINREAISLKKDNSDSPPNCQVQAV
jgi:hypothetical protein